MVSRYSTSRVSIERAFNPFRLKALNLWKEALHALKLLCSYLNARVCHVTRLIERPRLKLKSRVPQIRHTPIAAIRRCRIRTPQHTVNSKFDTRDANVIACGCGDRYRRSPYDDRVVSRIRNGDSWWSCIAAATARSGETDAAHRT